MKCEYCNKVIETPYTIRTFTHTSEGEKNITKRHYCNVECCNASIKWKKT